jgi:hypothetical protein
VIANRPNKRVGVVFSLTVVLFIYRVINLTGSYAFLRFSARIWRNVENLWQSNRAFKTAPDISIYTNTSIAES